MKYGEIDLIVRKGRDLRFIEVKSSIFHEATFFTPEIRVNARKIRKLKQLCEAYLLETHAPQDQLWQIDVISVILNEDFAPRSINHIENAIFERKY